jgi:hypothetical protein
MQAEEIATYKSEVGQIPIEGSDTIQENRNQTPDQDWIAEDIQFVRDNLPEAAILTLTREYITVVIM